MSVSFETKATNRGVITFTIGQDKIKPALDQAFNKVKKNLNALNLALTLLHNQKLISNQWKKVKNGL